MIPRTYGGAPIIQATPQTPVIDASVFLKRTLTVPYFYMYEVKKAHAYWATS